MKGFSSSIIIFLLFVTMVFCAVAIGTDQNVKIGPQPISIGDRHFTINDTSPVTIQSKFEFTVKNKVTGESVSSKLGDNELNTVVGIKNGTYVVLCANNKSCEAYIKSDMNTSIKMGYEMFTMVGIVITLGGLFLFIARSLSDKKQLD